MSYPSFRYKPKSLIPSKFKCQPPYMYANNSFKGLPPFMKYLYEWINCTPTLTHKSERPRLTLKILGLDLSKSQGRG